MILKALKLKTLGVGVVNIQASKCNAWSPISALQHQERPWMVAMVMSLMRAVLTVTADSRQHPGQRTARDGIRAGNETSRSLKFYNHGEGTY